MRKILILLLFGCFCFSEEIILDREITKKKIEELEKIKEGTKDPEILKKIYPVLIEKYDKQAEYGKKHRSMKEYAEILYPEKEKQVEYLKNEADKLREQGEIGEAIVLYRLIVKEYPQEKDAKESYFQLRKLFKNEMDSKSVIECYEILIKKYENTITDREWVEIISDFRFFKKYDRAIELSKIMLNKYPEGPFAEDALFILGTLYKETKDLGKAKEIWKNYLQKYPESIRSLTIKKFLQNGQ